MSTGVDIHILDKGGSLNRIRPVLVASLDSAISRVSELLDVRDVDIVVHPGRRVIPELGMTGFSYGPHHLTIAVSPELNVPTETLTQRVLGLLGHELHHCVRSNGPGVYRTLLDLVISEGLACKFEEELVGEVPFYAWPKGPLEMDRLRVRLREEGCEREFDHAAWFFGSAPTEIPRHAGYSVGFALVSEKLAHRGVTAAEAVMEPTSWFE